MIHAMRLMPEPFERIEQKTKNIEYRLWDDKRRKLNVGDRIVFTNIKDDRQLEARVIALYKAHTFSELKTILIREGKIRNYSDFEPSRMQKYYSKEDEYKYGVVGILVSVIEEETKEVKVDTYKEEFGEKSSITVANFVLKNIIENKYHSTGFMCASAARSYTETAAIKIECFFTSDSIDVMAYYIQFLNEHIDEEKYDEYLKNYNTYTKNDIGCLLVCAMNMSYRIYGIRKSAKDLLEEYELLHEIDDSANE